MRGNDIYDCCRQRWVYGVFDPSNYFGMGSGVVPEGVGFMLQNRGALFNLDENHANVYAPGKRPFHTIIPAFVTKDGVPFLSFGVMGGDFQPQGHAQIVMNIVDFGMNTQEAGDAPRWDHKGSSSPRGNQAKTGGNPCRIWNSLQTIRQLMSRGHDVGFTLGEFGGYQAILWDEKTKYIAVLPKAEKTDKSADIEINLTIRT